MVVSLLQLFSSFSVYMQSVEWQILFISHLLSPSWILNLFISTLLSFRFFRSASTAAGFHSQAWTKEAREWICKEVECQRFSWMRSTHSEYISIYYTRGGDHTVLLWGRGSGVPPPMEPSDPPKQEKTPVQTLLFPSVDSCLPKAL